MLGSIISPPTRLDHQEADKLIPPVDLLRYPLSITRSSFEGPTVSIMLVLAECEAKGRILTCRLIIKVAASTSFELTDLLLI